MGKEIKYLRLTLSITTIILCVLVVLSSFCLTEGDRQFNIKDSDIVQEDELSLPKDEKVIIYREKLGIVEELPLEEYITGVVASEMPANFNEEALKAQAVAARTFYMSSREHPCSSAKAHDAEICDTVGCQVYMSKEERMNLWSKEKGEEYWKKISDAVMSTKGEVLVYNNEILRYPQYFAISSGKTEDAKDVLGRDISYLKSVESDGDEMAPKFKSSKNIPISNFIDTIESNYPKFNSKEYKYNDIINILSYNNSGSVNDIKIGNMTMKGLEFRKIFKLNSTFFTIDIRNGIVTINCTGYGHGLGMSQWGANYMGKNGKKYKEILTHYYSGIEIKTLNRK